MLIFVNILATAGNETTNRLIGWTAKLLAEHPDQRRDLRENRDLIPNAIEEILRFEPPAIQICRTVTRDVVYYGRTVPAGSIMMFLSGSANRDHRAFPPDGTSSTSVGSSATTSPSVTASTSVSVPLSPVSKDAWRSTRSSTASQTGRSI